MRASSTLLAVSSLAFLLAGPLAAAGPARPAALNPANPAQTVKLVFVHHSTGENWLSDDNDNAGLLGIALRDANYFVSDTNYGWGPVDEDAGGGTIGDHTDVGQYYGWFAGPHAATYLAALYPLSDQNSSYTRLDTDPGGENGIVMFKSCFPNSYVGGSPSDPIPPIDSNPLRYQDWSSEHHTVGNTKGIYQALLSYFATRQDKMFVLITSPPQMAADTDEGHAANARVVSEWLVNDWLASYPHHNVFVFDFYNVLTSDGGPARTDDPNTNDLDWADGNHHRYRNGAIEHMRTVSNNISAYWSGDSHPSHAGGLKATGEFVSLLNIAYHCWKGTGSCPGAAATGASFYTVTPCRVVDTRTTSAPVLSAGETRTFTVTGGACGIPAQASSISANVTVTEPAAAGWLSLFPGGSAFQGTSTLNFTAGKTRANNARLVLAADGSGGLNVRNGSVGTAHVILDVNGYFR